jgi:large subunit ribosomal protein L11
MIIPVIISVYDDRSFSFIMKSPPAAVLLKQAASIAKGSPEPNKSIVGQVTLDQVKEIAEIKKNDLNAIDIDGAIQIIKGTAKSAGIKVV